MIWYTCKVGTRWIHIQGLDIQTSGIRDYGIQVFNFRVIYSGRVLTSNLILLTVNYEKFVLLNNFQSDKIPISVITLCKYANFSSWDFNANKYPSLYEYKWWTFRCAIKSPSFYATNLSILVKRHKNHNRGWFLETKEANLGFPGNNLNVFSPTSAPFFRK